MKNWHFDSTRWPVDAVVLSRTHIDHSGTGCPALVKGGLLRAHLRRTCHARPLRHHASEDSRLEVRERPRTRGALACAR